MERTLTPMTCVCGARGKTAPAIRAATGDARYYACVVCMIGLCEGRDGCVRMRFPRGGGAYMAPYCATCAQK